MLPEEFLQIIAINYVLLNLSYNKFRRGSILKDKQLIKEMKNRKMLINLALTNFIKKVEKMKKHKEKVKKGEYPF